MSFQRKAFLVGLAVLAAFGAVAAAMHRPDDEFRGSAIGDLIHRAERHAKELRHYAANDPRYSLIDEEAKGWEQLAAAAKTELINLTKAARPPP